MAKICFECGTGLEWKMVQKNRYLKEDTSLPYCPKCKLYYLVLERFSA